MRKLVFSMNVSLDGYMEDTSGRFDWSVPDEEVAPLRQRGAPRRRRRRSTAAGCGRRCGYWGTDDPSRDEASAEFARVWAAGAEVRRLAARSTEVENGATLLRDPDADVARLKEQEGGPLYVSGAETAARLAGLLDELDVYAYPVIVAGGKPAWTVPMKLELIDSRTFASGVVYSRYDVTR